MAREKIRLYMKGALTSLRINQTKRDLIIEVWEALDCESIGASELEQIQSVLRDRFGDGAVDSPALIARTLADEGAVLRHPEVLDFDTKWREQNLSDLISPNELNFSGLREAAESIKKLDAMRQKIDLQLEQRPIRELVLKIKDEIQALARSRIVSERERLEADEIVQWLTVWLQEPELFEDWLSLRQQSPEFAERFCKRASS
jgi:hypothetical protein